MVREFLAEAQSIGSGFFFGASGFFNFKKDFEGAQLFKLERNYRSSPEIITVANNVIKNNQARLNKNMYTKNNQGVKPVLYNSYDERDEALFVAKNISNIPPSE